MPTSSCRYFTAWECKHCPFMVSGGMTIKTMTLKKRLHQKVCNHSGGGWDDGDGSLQLPGGKFNAVVRASVFRNRGKVTQTTVSYN